VGRPIGKASCRDVVGDSLHDLDTICMHHDALDPLAQHLCDGVWPIIVAGPCSFLHKALDFLSGNASDRTGTSFVVLQ
jgi:hypothetical protein